MWQGHVWLGGVLGAGGVVMRAGMAVRVERVATPQACCSGGAP